MEKRTRAVGLAIALVGLLTGSIVLADIVAGSSTTAVSSNVAYSLITLNKPADAATGDVLLASVSVNGGMGATVVPPSGWTLIGRTDNDTNVSLLSYWKVVSASESGPYTWTVSPQTRAAGGITRYSGVDTTLPIDAFAGSIGRGTTAQAPSVSTSALNERVVAAFATNVGTNSSMVFSTTTGMTKQYDIKYTPFGPTMTLQDMAQAVVGVTGPFSSLFSTSPRDWAAQSIALKNAGGIAFNNAALLYNGTPTNSFSGSYTVNGPNPILFVYAWGAFGYDSITSVTYGGRPLTEVATVAPERTASLWVLAAPPIGPNTLTVTGSDIYNVIPISYTGAKQVLDGSGSAGLDATATNIVSSVDAITSTVTTVSNNDWILMVSKPALKAGVGATTRMGDPGSYSQVFDSGGSVNVGNTSMTLTGVSDGGNVSAGTIMAAFAPAI